MLIELFTRQPSKCPMHIDFFFHLFPSPLCISKRSMVCAGAGLPGWGSLGLASSEARLVYGTSPTSYFILPHRRLTLTAFRLINPRRRGGVFHGVISSTIAPHTCVLTLPQSYTARGIRGCLQHTSCLRSQYRLFYPSEVPFICNKGIAFYMLLQTCIS